MAISNRPINLVAAPSVQRTPATASATPVAAKLPAAPAAAPAPRKGWDVVLVPMFHGLHRLLAASPRLNHALGRITGPIVKNQFNPPAGTPEKPGPAPLKAATIEQARQLMAKTYDPAHGKAVICISGTGAETVHCFVVSGVKPDGSVMITQALAEDSGPKEDYSGIGGHIQKWMDKLLHNSDRRMLGVVESSWSDYAVESKRNSIVVMEVDADPAKLQATLEQLKTFVGRPYDHSMLSTPQGTEASNQEMFCTEVSSWFINQLHPGTITQSEKHGWSVYQVADHMRATNLHGGPLKVLYNGQNRLDLAANNPVSRFN